MMATPSEDNITGVVFQLGSLKSPGLDGYLAKLYQHMWDSIGYDIIAVEQGVFRNELSQENKQNLYSLQPMKNNHPGSNM